jgi:RHH-type proline utilization regulon transcriptional repressor/proline dehydrogenase/delta 1-pyrroline-5-carboxylate dehydrogenase
VGEDPARDRRRATSELMAESDELRDPGDHAAESHLIGEAIQLARRLQERANALQTPQEKRQQAEFDRMIQHPADKATLVQLTDQAFRSSASRRAADQLTHVLDVQGVPRFFSPLDRTLLRGFQSFGGYLPGVAVPLVKEKMQQETANVVLPAEPELLAKHLEARRLEGVRMNVNFLGEALLGEGEAERRLEGYLEALQNPAIEVVSVKISTVYSQISAIAREQTIAQLCDRLELLFRAAAKARYERADGTVVPKLLYLDMEEYRDLWITVEAFVRTLDRPGLEGAQAGIALQAYIPDSFAAQRRLSDWAMRRVAKGGAPVMVRIVKGANMEMERVEASLHGRPAATFQNKRETDANYKRMLRYALDPARVRAVNIGVASHNLFELAYALVLSGSRGVREHIHFEMLEGMVNHQRRALFEETEDLLLYAPACRKENFINAIGYLVRRLDENTGPDNFLRHAFRLSVDSEQWRDLERDFADSFDLIATLPDAPRHQQDRRGPAPEAAVGESGLPSRTFRNEPDTNFALAQHAEWAQNIVDTWSRRHGSRALEVPLVVAGNEERGNRPIRETHDPSRPEHVVARCRIGDQRDVDVAVDCARRDPDGWREESFSTRSRVLRRVAQVLRERRAELMGIALAEGGKILIESDPEVSEAIDFCEFYPRSAESIASLPGVEAHGKGVVVVIPPWNFPIAIPCGGISAALAAGNTVIVKPAPETIGTAWLLCGCFWAAGVSRNVLQFVFAENDGAATHLATHSGVDRVIFTGGTATAFRLLEQDPGLPLLAETGGKNAMIVTAMSDRDLAIKHLLHSAFGHAGQKCSATSLLILEQEVYEDAAFRETLCDAVASLKVGSAWDLATVVGPLIRPVTGALERGLKELDEGESWALRPRTMAGYPRVWSPGIKWGVGPGSFTHETELFGPVLGVMCARDLDEAIDFVHRTGYGLTSGLQSLDDREQERWSERLRAGNLYQNRGTTGAVVLRQPFGGMAHSAIGPGLKAGGPNYVSALMNFHEDSDELVETEGVDPSGRIREEQGGVSDVDERVARLLDDLERRSTLSEMEMRRLRRAARSYAKAVDEEFAREHDSFRLVGQDNLRRYRPVGLLRIRVEAGDQPFDLFARVLAARVAGCGITVSTPGGLSAPHVAVVHDLTESWAASIEFLEESDGALAEAIRQGQTERIRYAGPNRVGAPVLAAAAETGLHLATEPVRSIGRIELLHYVREQSLCIDYHRYGNLGARTHEQRSPVD